MDRGGQIENLERAQKRLTVILPITIGIIFVLLFFPFGSAKWACPMLMNVPFSLVGGILVLYMRGIHPGVSAAVGFIMSFGSHRKRLHRGQIFGVSDDRPVTIAGCGKKPRFAGRLS